MIDFNVISTGSKGNAVVINKSILIDCGVPWKSLLGVCWDLRLVLLTHIHGDHFNRSTVRKLAWERPALRFGCCEWMVAPLMECGVDKRRIDVIDSAHFTKYSPELSVYADPLLHDVPNTAWHVYINGEKILYATDTNSMDGIEAKGYDLYLIEANYSENEIVERIRRKQENGEYCHEWDVLNNHLSREKAEDWLYKNMGPHSQYVFLHEHEE